MAGETQATAAACMACSAAFLGAPEPREAPKTCSVVLQAKLASSPFVAGADSYLINSDLHGCHRGRAPYNQRR